MGKVRLSGQLICRDVGEVVLVAQHLPEHVKLTRAEPGCVVFEVRQTDNPLVWQVDELFDDADAFAAHQERVVVSDWGRATAGIERRYTVDGFTSSGK